jgi:hypothetical protein
MRVWWLPWRKIRRAVNRQGFQLDLNAWNGVLASWAESGDPNAANHMRLVIEKLQKMIEQQQKLPGSDDNTTTLTAYTYNTLLSCYARQGTVEAAESVEQLFQWMEKQENQRLRPDRDSYLDLILAWCNAKKPERGELNLLKLWQGLK